MPFTDAIVQSTPHGFRLDLWNEVKLVGSFTTVMPLKGITDAVWKAVEQGFPEVMQEPAGSWSYRMTMRLVSWSWRDNDLNLQWSQGGFKTNEDASEALIQVTRKWLQDLRRHREVEP